MIDVLKWLFAWYFCEVFHAVLYSCGFETTAWSLILSFPLLELILNLNWMLALLQKMLDYLKDKKDVGFFQSLAGLMQSCR